MNLLHKDKRHNTKSDCIRVCYKIEAHSFRGLHISDVILRRPLELIDCHMTLTELRVKNVLLD